MAERIQAHDEQTARFVVLKHMDRQGPHFDLMIDVGQSLATWKCYQPPEAAAESRLRCVRLENHRRRYLEYEGALSGARGDVRRYDQGECIIHEQAPGRWELTFGGQCLAGRFALEALSAAGDEWCLRFTPAP